MSSKSNITSFIIVAGIIVLVVFSGVLALNLLPNYESNSYYAKTDVISASIESLEYKDNILTIKTKGNAKSFCVKSTRSTPEDNNLCWKNIDNNMATTSIYSNKKYYVWIKDENNNVSSPTIVKAN